MRLWLNHVAREAGRYGLSDCTTATICITLLCELGLVTKRDQTMIIDKSKVKRKEICFETN